MKHQSVREGGDGSSGTPEEIPAFRPGRNPVPVRAALSTYRVHGLTIMQVTGFGIELWRTQTYRGSTFHDESVSNVRLELVSATRTRPTW